MPEVSVIIPLYNKGPHIARAINSVLNQNLQDFEIIVMDGNSNDDGPKIVNDIQDPRIYFSVQCGTGVATARNQAVKMAKSELVAFLDADDEWTQKHLETLVRMRDKYPEAGLYSTFYKRCTKKCEIIPVCNRGIPKEPFEGILPHYFRIAALGDPPIWTSVVGVPKKIFIEIGGFPEGEWMGEDHALWAKIALKYPIAFSSQIGGIYHTDAVNRVCDTHILLMEEPVVKMGKAAIAEGTVPSDLKEDLQEYIAFKEIYRARKHIVVDQFPEARRILLDTRTRYHNNERIFLLLVSLLPTRLFHLIYSLKRSDFL